MSVFSIPTLILNDLNTYFGDVLKLIPWPYSEYPLPLSPAPPPTQVAAVKQLEESKTKIENLLDWLSNVDKDSERAGITQKQVIEQNGTHCQEGDSKSAIGEEDEVNGNLLETDVDGPLREKNSTEENLNQQVQKVKVCVLMML